MYDVQKFYDMVSNVTLVIDDAINETDYLKSEIVKKRDELYQPIRKYLNECNKLVNELESKYSQDVKCDGFVVQFKASFNPIERGIYFTLEEHYYKDSDWVLIGGEYNECCFNNSTLNNLIDNWDCKYKKSFDKAFCNLLTKLTSKESDKAHAELDEMKEIAKVYGIKC